MDKDIQIAILQHTPNIVFCLNHMQLSKVIWAMGVWKRYPGELVMDCIERTLVRNGSIFHDAVGMVKVLWGCSRVLHKLPDDYLCDLEKCVFHRRDELLPYAWAKVCWAFAAVSYIVSDNFINETAMKIKEAIKLFTLDDFSSIVWALSVFGLEKIVDQGFFEVALDGVRYWQQMIKNNRRHQMQTRDFCLMALKLSKCVEADIPQHVAYHPEQHLDMSIFRTNVLTYTQKMIIEKTGKRYHFKNCARNQVFGFVIHMLVSDDKNRFAIEAVGPGWYCRPGTTMNGHRIIRQRVITACGIEIIAFPFHEWYSKKASNELRKYVSQKLTPVLRPSSHVKCDFFQE